MIKKIVIKLYYKYVTKKNKLFNGFGSVLAGEYLKDFVSNKRNVLLIHKIHKRGFNLSDWNSARLSFNNSKNYLSTVDYYKMHPFNNYAFWIDDKLTLKYLLYGTDLDIMPKYYFQIDNYGNILPILDNSDGENTVNAIISLLKIKKDLAVKRIIGDTGNGFYKLSFKNEKFYVNNVEEKEERIISLLNGLRNYLIIEYLFPHINFTKLSGGTVNTIRYLIGREQNKIFNIKSYIRFGTLKSKCVENYNAGGVLCYINENGFYSSGNIFDFKNKSNIIIQNHPDNGERLTGEIPFWKDIQEYAVTFSNKFPQLSYLGFDFVVTSNNEIKILEINSLTSLDALQIDKSILEGKCGDFFKKRMKA